MWLLCAVCCYTTTVSTQADKKKTKQEAAERAALEAAEEAKRLLENPDAPPAPAAPKAAEEDAAEAKRRVRERSETVRKAEEANAIRVEPLGADRRHNRYWRFGGERVPGGDAARARVFVERADTGEMQVLGTSEALEGLMGLLFRQGAREGPLHSSLLRHRAELQSLMPVGGLAAGEEAAAGEGCLGGLVKEAPLPGVPYRAGDDAAMTQLKAVCCTRSQVTCTLSKQELLHVRASLPPAAVADPAAIDAGWASRVKAAADVAGLRACLGALEASLNDDHLSGMFARDPLLVKGAWVAVGREVASAVPGPLTGQPLQLADDEERPMIDGVWLYRQTSRSRAYS